MFVKFFPVSRFTVGACALAVLSVFISSENAHARCSIRVADVLIKARYQGCNPKAMLSYLYSDLVTPFSFTCAKRLRETCHKENCADPKTPEEEQRCLSRYAEVLNACPDEIEGAAKMARCKDTKTWAVNVPVRNPSSAALTAPTAEHGVTAAPVSTTSTASTAHTPVEVNAPTTAAAVTAPVAAAPMAATAPVTVTAPTTTSVSNAPAAASVTSAPITASATATSYGPMNTPAMTGPAPIQVAPAPVLAPAAPTATTVAAPIAAPATAQTSQIAEPMAVSPTAPTTVYRPIMTAPAVAPTPAPNPAMLPRTQSQLIPTNRQNRIRITNPTRSIIYRASQSSPAHP